MIIKLLLSISVCYTAQLVSNHDNAICGQACSPPPYAYFINRCVCTSNEESFCPQQYSKTRPALFKALLNKLWAWRNTFRLIFITFWQNHSIPSPSQLL